MIVATPATWAYIHGQLDYSRKYRIHICSQDGRKTLCGLRTSGAWEYHEVENLSTASEWICERCKRANERTTITF